MVENCTIYMVATILNFGNLILLRKIATQFFKVFIT